MSKFRLAASILAEEIGRSSNCASKSADPFHFGENGEGYEDEDNDEDEDEEIMLVSFCRKVKW